MVGGVAPDNAGRRPVQGFRDAKAVRDAAVAGVAADGGEDARAVVQLRLPVVNELTEYLTSRLVGRRLLLLLHQLLLELGRLLLELLRELILHDLRHRVLENFVVGTAALRSAFEQPRRDPLLS